MCFTKYDLGVSYNQPKLCSNATWNAAAITFAGSNIIGPKPFGVFVNRQNTVYAINRQNSTLFVWFNQTTIVTKSLHGYVGDIALYSLFVNEQNEIFVDNGYAFNQVERYTLNSTNYTAVMPVCLTCDGIFVDIKNNVYLNGFLNDKTNRLIGWVKIKQNRITTKLCSDRKIIQICSSKNEDQTSYFLGWTNQTIDEQLSSSIMNSFRYSNGYIYDLRGSLNSLQTNLSLLHQFQWIDQRTKQIQIEMTLYNPDVQLFISIRFISQFPSTGQISSNLRIQSIQFYRSFFSFSLSFRNSFLLFVV